MLAVRGHVAVVPGGAELGQIDGHDLVDVTNLRASQKGRNWRSKRVRDFLREECSSPRASSSSRNMRIASLTVA